MPFDDGYCNALLLAHWSVRQKLNHVSSVQLRRYARAVTRTGAFLSHTDLRV